MKPSLLFCAGFCTLFFTAGALASGNDSKPRRDHSERHQREFHRDNHHVDRHDRHRRAERPSNRSHQNLARRHHNHHRHGYYDRHHNKRHYYKKKRHHHRDRHAEYFLGGLIIGSLGHGAHQNHHYYNDYPQRHGHRYGHRISFWMDSYGDCYRVEHRPRGKVYTEVPRYKCY